MFNKTKREFQVAGSFLGSRGLAVVLIAVVMTIFEKNVLEKVIGIGWYWVIPILIVSGVGFFWVESKLNNLAEKHVFKRLDVVVEGLHYKGAESVSLAQREFVCQVQSGGKTVNKLVIEHLCKTKKAHFFLLQYSHIFSVIYNMTVVPCTIEMIMELYPDVYELDFGVVEVA